MKKTLVVLALVLSSCGTADDETRKTSVVLGNAFALLCPCGECQDLDWETAVLRIAFRWSGTPGVVDQVEETIFGQPFDTQGLPHETSVDVTASFWRPGDELPLLVGRGEGTTSPDGRNLSLEFGQLQPHGSDCCGPDVLPGWPNTLFPTATLLPDGRILIAGGFTQIGDAGERWEITGASDRAYIWNPSDGEIRQTGNLMNNERGAAGAVYLSATKQVLLVGGAEALYLEKSESCFPWYFDKETIGSVAKSYELFDVNAEQFVVWDKTLQYALPLELPRVFPRLLPASNDSVFISGGGYWPSCRTQHELNVNYRQIEVYHPDFEGPAPLFAAPGALSMATTRSAAAAFSLTGEDGLALHVFWGGSEGGPTAELYAETPWSEAGVWGYFETVQFAAPKNYKKKPFFHAVAPLGDRKFLVTGGVSFSKGALHPPSAQDAWLVTLDENLVAHMEQVEGLDAGRYMHSAFGTGHGKAVVFGGFGSDQQGEETSFSAAALSDVRFLDPGGSTLYRPGLDDPGGPVAGAGNVIDQGGCLFIAGGTPGLPEGLSFKDAGPSLDVRIYCPSSLVEPWEWGDVE